MLRLCLFCAIYYVLLYPNFQHCQENFEVASNAYKEALEMAAMKKILHSLPILYVHLFFVTYMIRELCKTNFQH